MKLRWIWWIAVAALALGTVSGCGPSAAELQAREQAKRQAEEARLARLAAIKAEQEARARRILEAEQAADAFAKLGKKQEALESYVKALRETEPNGNDDYRIREKSIRLVQTLPVEPDVPDDALRHAVRGRAKFKNAAPGDYKAAVDEFRAAVTLAPWWDSGYNALAVAQEADRQYAGAIQSLKLYLATKPKDADARAIKNKLYELEVALEDYTKAQALAGAWRDQHGNSFAVRVVDGGKLVATGSIGHPVTIEADRNGNALKGFAAQSAYRSNYCSIPGETTPASGKIAADGQSVELEFIVSSYKTDNRWVGLCCGLYECTQVTLMEKRPRKLLLRKLLAPAVVANPQASAK